MSEKQSPYEVFKKDLDTNTRETMVRIQATLETIEMALEINKGLMPWQKRYLLKRRDKLKKILISLNQSLRTRED